MAPSLILAVEESLDQILESPASRFLISQLSCDLPISYLFSKVTHYELCIRPLTFQRIIDGRFIRYGFVTIWTYNLVSHLLSFLGNWGKEIFRW